MLRRSMLSHYMTSNCQCRLKTMRTNLQREAGGVRPDQNPAATTLGVAFSQDGTVILMTESYIQ